MESVHTVILSYRTIWCWAKPFVACSMRVFQQTLSQVEPEALVQRSSFLWSIFRKKGMHAWRNASERKQKNFLLNYFYVKSVVTNLIMNLSFSFSPFYVNTPNIASNQFYGGMDKHHHKHNMEGWEISPAIKLAALSFFVDFLFDVPFVEGLQGC